MNTQSMLEMLQRSEVSNPPAFGAKIASEVLNNHELRQMWYADMISMSGRIRSMRWALYQELVSLGECSTSARYELILLVTLQSHKGAPGTWDHLVQQSGMFGFLGLSPEVVLKLRGKRTGHPFAQVLMHSREHRALPYLYGRQLSHLYCRIESRQRRLCGALDLAMLGRVSKFGEWWWL